MLLLTKTNSTWVIWLRLWVAWGWYTSNSSRLNNARWVTPSQTRNTFWSNRRCMKPPYNNKPTTSPTTIISSSIRIAEVGAMKWTNRRVGEPDTRSPPPLWTPSQAKLAPIWFQVRTIPKPIARWLLTRTNTAPHTVDTRAIMCRVRVRGWGEVILKKWVQVTPIRQFQITWRRITWAWHRRLWMDAVGEKHTTSKTTHYLIIIAETVNQIYISRPIWSFLNYNLTFKTSSLSTYIT